MRRLSRRSSCTAAGSASPDSLEHPTAVQGEIQYRVSVSLIAPSRFIHTHHPGTHSHSAQPTWMFPLPARNSITSRCSSNTRQTQDQDRLILRAMLNNSSRHPHGALPCCYIANYPPKPRDPAHILPPRMTDLQDGFPLRHRSPLTPTSFKAKRMPRFDSICSRSATHEEHGALLTMICAHWFLRWSLNS